MELQSEVPPVVSALGACTATSPAPSVHRRGPSEWHLLRSRLPGGQVTKLQLTAKQMRWRGCNGTTELAKPMGRLQQTRIHCQPTKARVWQCRRIHSQRLGVLPSQGHTRFTCAQPNPTPPSTGSGVTHTAQRREGRREVCTQLLHLQSTCDSGHSWPDHTRHRDSTRITTKLPPSSRARRFPSLFSPRGRCFRLPRPPRSETKWFGVGVAGWDPAAAPSSAPWSSLLTLGEGVLGALVRFSLRSGGPLSGIARARGGNGDLWVAAMVVLRVGTSGHECDYTIGAGAPLITGCAMPDVDKTGHTVYRSMSCSRVPTRESVARVPKYYDFK